MEIDQLREMVRAWRTAASLVGTERDWTNHAQIFFEGARAAAQAAGDEVFVSQINMILGSINAWGINPLLEIAA
jgi:hypothetical protein